MLTINEYIAFATAKANGTLKELQLIKDIAGDKPAALALQELICLLLTSRRRTITLDVQCECGKWHELEAGPENIFVTGLSKDTLELSFPDMLLEFRYPRIFEDTDYATMIENCIVRVNDIEWSDATAEERENVADALTFNRIREVISLLTSPQCYALKSAKCECGKTVTRTKIGYNLLEL